MDYSWLTTSWSSILMVILTTVGIYATLIIYTRLAGLRSFSKMSSFDFAMTVAIGSLIASTILTKDPPLIQAMVALAMLYLLQITIAKLRDKSKSVAYAVDNQPVLLMRGSEILDDNLKEAKVTHDDLRAKLREANVTQWFTYIYYSLLGISAILGGSFVTIVLLLYNTVRDMIGVMNPNAKHRLRHVDEEE